MAAGGEKNGIQSVRHTIINYVPINGILYFGGTRRQRHGNSIFFYMGPYVFTHTVDSGFIVPTPVGHRSLVLIDWLEGGNNNA